VAERAGGGSGDEGGKPSVRGLSGWFWLVAALGVVKIVVCLPGFFFADVLSRPRPFPAWIYLASIAAFGECATLLIGGGRSDARAAWLGLHYLAFASVFSDRFLIRLTGVEWIGGLPGLLAALRPDAFGPALLWLFAREFPEGGTFGAARRIPSAMIPLAAGAGLVLSATSAASGVLRMQGFAVPPSLELLDPQSPRDLYWTTLIVLTVSALLFIVWKARFAVVNERRRVGVFVAGLVAGSLPAMVITQLEALVPAFRERIAQPDARWLSGIVMYSMLLSIPLTTTYAVIVDQVLDVRLVVRNALQYGLARYSAVALLSVPLFVAGAVVYRYRESTLSELMTGNGISVLAVVAIAAAVGARYGPRLFSTIDRRFFREQYDARRILSDLIPRSGRARSMDELAALLTAEVDHALHVHSIALFAINPPDNSLVAPDGRMRPLRRDTPLAVLVGGRTDPLQIDLRDAALRRLPESDRLWLVDGGFRLLVPLMASDGGVIGMLGLGEKRSDLPFSVEDRRLLCDVAASAGLALENLLARTFSAAGAAPSPTTSPHGRRTRDETDEAAGECMQCGAVQRASEGPCETCGADVCRAPVPHVLHGKFRVERRVGVGGMAVVYRGLDLVLNRAVAIKTLPRLSHEDAARLRREARAMAALSHPNLALVFGAETWRGTPLLIVEYLEAGTLADRLRRGPLPVAEVTNLGMALADGLTRVHNAGLLHRDIKPSNIGFTADGVPKLLDFGVAKIVARSQSSDSFSGPSIVAPTATAGGVSVTVTDGLRYVLGTATYLSPEAVRGTPPDPSVDLWALALVMYESITGRNPVERPSLFDTFDCIARAEIPDLRSAVPGCSAAMGAFLADALALDRMRRPSSARDFRARLERISTDLRAAV